MATIASVADIHRVDKVERIGHVHMRRPLVGVRVYIKLTATQAGHFERVLGKARSAPREELGKGWTYSSHVGQLLIAVYGINDNPWGLTDTAEIAQKALELVNRKLEALRRRG